MSPYCGNGRSSWLRAMFACLENGPAAEERIGHLGAERGRAQREVLRIELVDVDRRVHRAAERQMVAARPDVADRERHIAP